MSLGCGNGIDRYPVSGQVLIDGKPLAHGLVKVVPVGARPASSQLDSEGRFCLVTSGVGEGVPAGTHAVQVSGKEYVDTYTVRWHAPIKYSKLQKSGLTIDVEEATDDVIIELTWGGRKPFVKKYN